MKIMKIAFSTMIALILLCANVTGQQYRNAPLIHIEVAETMTDDPESQAVLADFDKALASALAKKKVPVTLVTDKNKAQLVIRGRSEQSEGGRAAAVKTLIFGSGGAAKTDVTIQVVDIENSTVPYVYFITIKNDDFKSASEKFAQNFKKDLSKWR